AELDELLEDDRRAGAAHARSLNRDALSLPGAGVAEEPALLVDLLHVVEVGLGDVLRTERIAREEDRIGVLPRLGSEVDRHGATLTGALQAAPAKPTMRGRRRRARRARPGRQAGMIRS